MVDVIEAGKNSIKTNAEAASRLSVAPMMEWTDRHCRHFHRLFSCHVLLYTEMLTARALVRGDGARLLRDEGADGPVAVQLGGADPGELGRATILCRAAGFQEVNLNVGCPSDRVRSGAFGAVLMKSPDVVGACVSAMIEAAGPMPVTVKCRIGVDDQEPREVLPHFLETIRRAGVRRVQIHARKAWLQGLNPKKNRQVPPLDHDLVLAMKRAFPDIHISVNGGVESLEQARDLLARGLDGVMIGRAAYQRPADLLLGVDTQIYNDETPAGGALTAHHIAREMRAYIARHLAQGGRMHSVTRHMLGLFAGRPGARRWRRILSEGARDDADTALKRYDAALAAVPDDPAPENAERALA